MEIYTIKNNTIRYAEQYSINSPATLIIPATNELYIGEDDYIFSLFKKKSKQENHTQMIYQRLSHMSLNKQVYTLNKTVKYYQDRNQKMQKIAQ